VNHLTKLIINHRFEITGYFIAVILTFCAYAGILEQDFLQWDDALYIQNNSHIHALTAKNIYWMFTNYEQGNWHPLTWLSLAINLKLAGYNPVAFKLVNITLHLLNTFFVYLISLNILLRVRFNLQQRNATDNFHHQIANVDDRYLSIASMLTAMIFALHPQHVESVTWIAERKDVLCGFFYLLTLLSYLKFRESDQRKWLAISLVLFVFALMSKSMAVTLPFVLILLDVYPLKIFRTDQPLTHNLKLLLNDKISFIILAVAVSLITVITQRLGIQGSDSLTLESRIINACMSVILYLYKFIWPVNLSPLYPFHPWSSNPGIFSIIPVATVIGITYTCFYLMKKKIYFPIAALLYFLITLLPVIGLIKVGAQAAADRYTYLPSLSLHIMLAGGFAILLQNTTRRKIAKTVISSCLMVVTIMLSVATYNANKAWKNDETLWNKAISLYPGRAVTAYSNLATTYFNAGNFIKAKSLFIKALGITTNDFPIIEKLGEIERQLGNDHLALYYFNQLTKNYPDSAMGFIQLGDLYYAKRDLQNAKKYYNHAFDITPNSAATLQRKALVDYLNNDLPAAKHKIEYLLRIAPEDVGSLQLAANIYLKDNDMLRARRIADKVLILKPNDTFAIELIDTIKSKAELNDGN